MIVANFSPDKLEWQHIGVNGTIPAYNPDDPKKPHIVTFDDARANFILNKSAVRGLVQMNFGDDEEVKKAESLKIWRNFWERQIENHNQHNEQQKEAGNRYSRPTDELDEHAKLLGLELLRPWTAPVKSTKETEELRGENMALKKSMETLQAQMAEMMKMMISGGKTDTNQVTHEVGTIPPGVKTVTTSSPDTVGAELIKTNRNKYIRLGESNLNLWLSKNWEDVMVMPEENKLELEEKYLKLYGVPFPTERI